MEITAAQLLKAIATEEIILHYQPIYSLKSETDVLAGFEALSRWGNISPALFVPAAKRLGVLEELCRSVFKRAIAQSAEWELRRRRLWLSVNLNPTHLLDGGLAWDIKRMAIACGIDPLNLHLEITEGEELGIIEIQALQLLANDFILGVDDFGSGFSNLAHVAQAPIAFIKIDRSLCPSGMRDRKKIDLLQTIVILARRLEIEIVLEGIETEEQRIVAIVCGVDFGQGWYWSKALPPEQVEELFQGSGS